MRPVGALHLRDVGRPRRPAHPADRRRGCSTPTVGFLCAFAPSFTVLIVLRLLYGIGMGGEWGLGAALAMEKMPARAARLLLGGAPAGLRLRLPAGRPVSFLLVSDVLGLSWRWLFALSHPARADLAADPDPRRGVRGVAGHPASRMQRHQHAASSDVFLNGTIIRRFLYLVATYDRVQLDEPRHPGRLPDIPQSDSTRAAPGYRGVETALIDRRSSTTSARSSAG